MRTESLKFHPYHLDKVRVVNLGAFYTAPIYVDIVWNFIEPYIDKNTVILDPACGYGIFLTKKTIAKKIGNDIDPKALEIAKINASDAIYYNYNSLKTLDRAYYSIDEKEKLIIIGNPPYNDITSQAKKRLKKLEFDIDARVKSRDIGISFLRMFDFLKANYVCILHPLSYLVKKANFRLLKNFRENYTLLDGIIISSRHFHLTSKSSEFPIIIGLYMRTCKGMNFDYIENFSFKTIEGKYFRLCDFEYIGDYVEKYPKKNVKLREGDILFYTLRDINALKRNKTFIEKPTANAIKVDINKLDYYVYIDVFKDYIKHIPYYLRNLDILIKKELFDKYKPYFISYTLQRRPFLKKYYPSCKIYPNDKEFILRYFKELLGKHFIQTREEG